MTCFFCSMDRLARTWIVQRVVLHLKWRADQDTQRLSQVRDLLATVKWEDLAPCGGCHLPYDKSTGITCDECGRSIACSRACDPWAVYYCVECKEVVCVHCVREQTFCQRCFEFRRRQREKSDDSDAASANF